MKTKVLCWLLLVVGVSLGRPAIAAAQVGWMQPGVRLWYLGAVDGGNVISSNAEEAYLIDTVTGTNAHVVRHAAQTNWTAPLPVDQGTYSMLDQGPCWIHPQRLQTIKEGDYWRDTNQRITRVQWQPYTYATFMSSVLPAKAHFLPIKALFDLQPTRQLVKLTFMITMFSTGVAYFDADTGILLYGNQLWGVGKMFFILAEINYDFARQAAFAEDDGPHTGYWSMTSEQSQGNPFMVGGGSVIYQTLFETRYGSTLEMRVLSSRVPATWPDTGQADENYCFFGDQPILRRINATQAGNVLPEQWSPYGQYLWWWLPRTATGAQAIATGAQAMAASSSPAAAAVQTINVFDVPMNKTSDQPLTYTATQTPNRFHFSMLRFDDHGYMDLFAARDPSSGLHIRPGDYTFQNGTKVNGPNYYRTVMVQDADADSLPDSWETGFGLNPNLDTGDDGAIGDPDHDGRTNLQEYQAGTHPRGFYTRYFAEGAIIPGFFEVDLALLNVDPVVDGHVLLRYQREGDTTVGHTVAVPALGRRTVRVNDNPVMGTPAYTAFSTVIESDAPVVADRTMTWDNRHYGSHAETSIASPTVTWYLAEGATHSGFELYYLVQNPNTSAVTVQVTYLRPSPLAPVVKQYVVAASSRKTIYVNGEGPELAATDVSAKIESLDPALPIIVERAMYLTDGWGHQFGAGHESAGVTSPSTHWFLAEGATVSAFGSQGSFFDMFVLIANPNAAASTVTMTYLLPDGTTVTKTLQVAGNSRQTVYVNGADAKLADTSVSTVVTATQPVIVERAMWWPGPTWATWYEAHNSPGTTETGTLWALAEGESGGSWGVETYILIANTSAFAGQAKVTLLFEDGTPAAVQTFALLANSRRTIYPPLDFASALPAGTDRRYGVLIESLGTTPAQIVVERAMYSNETTGLMWGATWAAGTNAVGTKLR